MPEIPFVITHVNSVAVVVVVHNHYWWRVEGGRVVRALDSCTLRSIVGVHHSRTHHSTAKQTVVDYALYPNEIIFDRSTN